MISSNICIKRNSNCRLKDNEAKAMKLEEDKQMMHNYARELERSFKVISCPFVYITLLRRQHFAIIIIVFVCYVLRRKWPNKKQRQKLS